MLSYEAVLVVLCALGPVAVHSQRDCDDVDMLHSNRAPSGVYSIHPVDFDTPVDVYCDMDTDGGRWTVFQRRMDGTVNFYRPWDQYKRGFGNADGEYWLGLDNIFFLTVRRRYEMRVDMEDFSGNRAFARCTSFYIDSEDNGYMLHIRGFKDGGAGDSLSYHNGHRFSTLDREQDTWSGHCAREFHGAFWYARCHHANPNGLYLWGAESRHYAAGVNWYTFKGYYYSLKSISMKIRALAPRGDQDETIDGLFQYNSSTV